MNKKKRNILLSVILSLSLVISGFSPVLATEDYNGDSGDIVTEQGTTEAYEDVLDEDALEEDLEEVFPEDVAPEDDIDDEEPSEIEEGEVVASRRPVAPLGEAPPALAGDGVYSHRNWYPDITYEDLLNARPSPMARFAAGEPHHFDAVRSLGTPGVPSYGVMSIESVSVLYGGEYQARYRGQAGHGYPVYQGDSGDWYTTSRTATLMDGRVFTIHTHINASDLAGTTPEDFLNSLEYTYGGLALEEWLGGNMFNNPDIDFIRWAGDDLIAHADGSFTLESFIEFRSPYPQALATAINVPFPGYRGVNQVGFAAAMRHVVGVFDLSIHSGNLQLGSLPINLNLYDDFSLWGQVDSWARALQAEAGAAQTINNRHVDVTTLGQSHGGQEIWNIVIAESASAVNDYFEHTRPRMTGELEDLLALRDEIERGVHHRIPIYFHNIHPDEVTGVCAQLVMVEQLLRGDYLTFETVTEDQTFGITTNPIWGTPTPHPDGYVSVARGPLQSRDDTTTVTISVEEALHYFIFIFVPTNNPDGHNGMLRSNLYGFDLNRDASYQTQIENVLVIQDVLRWNPLAMLEFHGHVAHMLIEPTTGPHNPNYEYDLLHPPMLEAAHIMGRAAISGAYYRYLIPAEHMTDGWDDGGPMYMPVFLMHFGILGFTLEIPHTNQDSLDANIAMGWAFVDHAMDNFTDLFLNKLEHNRRGMTNADYAHLVDPFFRNPFTTPPTPIGRPRQEGQSFFPDYWVIPMDAFNQRNTLEAYNMLEKLERHGIDIERTTRRLFYNDYVFPAGTYVVDMRQARRGYVNTMLEAGYNASFFTAMYAEITMNFPDLRGFDAVSMWAEDFFQGHTVPVSQLSVPETALPLWDSPYVVVRNNNQDAIRLVNELLGDGVAVYMLTSYAQEGLHGDFVVAHWALTPSRLEGRFVETTALEEIPADAQQLVQPRIALLTAPRPITQGLFSPAPFIMRDLGFDYTWVTSNAALEEMVPGVDFNIIVSHNQNYASAWSISDEHGIPVIAVQSNAANHALHNLFADRDASIDIITGSREGTFSASYSPTSMITAHYGNANAAYLIGASTFETIPTGTTPLIRIADGAFEDVFLGGWWQGELNQANVPGRVTAFTGLTNADVPATIFGFNIFNRAHLQGYHNMFATAAFLHVAEIEEPGRPFATVSSSFDISDGRRLVILDFVASEVAGSTATLTQQMFKITGSPAAPVFNPATSADEGWLPYTGPITIHPEFEFIHWFAQNSYHVTAQGSINLGVIPAPPVSGTAVIDNMNPRIGDILTGSLVDGVYSGDLIFYWIVGYEILQIGYENTFEVPPEALGQMVTLAIFSTDQMDSYAVVDTEPVLRKVGPEAPAAPVVVARGVSHIVLEAHSGHEFRVGDGQWQASSTFTGLEPDTEYVFYQRIAQTAIQEASEASDSTTARTRALPPPPCCDYYPDCDCDVVPCCEDYPDCDCAKEPCCEEYPDCDCANLCQDCGKYPCECPEVDKTALAAAIQQAGTRVQANYTAASWATFAATLELARAIYADEDATQAQVNGVRNLLITAMNGLVRIVPPVPCEECEEYPCECEEDNRGPAGPAGPAGPPGAPGTPGAPGADGRPVPKTGDTANMSLWLIMFTLGFLGLTFASTKLTLANKQNIKPTLLLIKGDKGEDKVIVV